MKWLVSFLPATHWPQGSSLLQGRLGKLDGVGDIWRAPPAAARVISPLPYLAMALGVSLDSSTRKYCHAPIGPNEAEVAGSCGGMTESQPQLASWSACCLQGLLDMLQAQPPYQPLQWGHACPHSAVAGGLESLVTGEQDTNPGSCFIPQRPSSWVTCLWGGCACELGPDCAASAKL